MRTLVSLDIETTGLDPERDAILEIGIVKFNGDDILEEWSAIVNPNRDIPPKIIELTGITPEMVRTEGIGLWDALRETQRVVGTAPIIGHNIQFDLGFLRKQRLFPTNESIDTFELAGILVPHAGRYSLSSLGTALGIDIGDSHRALDDARTAFHLYRKIFERAVDLPNDVLEEIARHAEKLAWPLAPFWREALETQARGVFSTSIGAQFKRAKGQKTALSPAAQLRRQALRSAKPLKPNEMIKPLDIGEVAHVLSPGGAFSQMLPNFEARTQQIDMMRKVTQAFNEGDKYLIEAGTGTGKSLAYLIPAMLWAQQNGERVVISTNTINLQEQLADKDVPMVIEALSGKFSANPQSDDDADDEIAPPATELRAAVMKGKGRYVCQQRVLDLRKAGPRTLDEARLLTKILIWLPTTVTGDADELFFPAPGERAAFAHLSAQSPACNTNTCSASDCFFYQARRLAESAHVVIVNHALLLADIAVENRALPEYNYLVLDEGHHMEAAATDSLTYVMDRDTLLREFDDLARPAGGRGKASGLLSEIAGRCKQALPVQDSAKVEHACNLIAEQVQRATNAVDVFFGQISDFLANLASGESSDYAQKLRITRATRNSGGWSRVELSFDNFYKDLTIVVKSLNALMVALNEEAENIDNFDLQLARMTGAIRFFSEVSEQMHHMILKPSDDRIYWAEIEAPKFGRGSIGSRVRMPGVAAAANAKVRLYAAPLHVGPLMLEQVWKKKRGVVLTSATMRTATAMTNNQPTFDYIQNRLSAHDTESLAVGSPFDYKSSSLVYVVSDMPEPNQAGYQQMLERALIELFRASQGRGMALFTSYSALKMTSKVIAPELQKYGITVFEQSEGMSRRSLLEQFRAAQKGVLLGTRSFWEGVDVQGEQLSALAICKLPFDVPTDPIIAARSETFQDSFNEYSIPETVLRFRQGFGRLIRSKTDRGVVAILDRRVISKGYGAAFLNALPAPTIRRGPVTAMGQHVREWLKS
ncbi:MAG: exonuclease domain-containing protein [Anaerolineae bacterium]|nr:exonuclease domain-containing protein [Anaerolineae bacterium]